MQRPGSRRDDLKSAIAKALDSLNESADEIVLVAWFSTQGNDDIADWGHEGKPGTSVWLLSRRNMAGEDVIKVIGADMARSVHSIAPDGTVAKEDATDEGALRLIHLENSDERCSVLEFTLKGKRYRFRK